MNIKEEIGKRIANARKAAGLTVRELAEKLKGISQPRITNWEVGHRMPGPNEILQLAKILNVDAAYLACLSDVNSPPDYLKKKIIPVVPLSEATSYETFLEKSTVVNIEKFDHVLLDHDVTDKAFAIKIDDQSMLPQFEIGDIVVIDTAMKPLPGKFVLVKLEGHDKAMLRKYRQNQINAKNELSYELVPLNPDWPTLTVKDLKNSQILGVTVEQRRYPK